MGSTVDRTSRHDIHVRLAALIRDVQDRPPTEIRRALEGSTVTAVQYVPGAQYAGITVTDGRGHIDTPSAIGRYPGLLDLIQERHHEGPCLQAVRQHRTVRVDDLNRETRWPKYQRDALAQTPIRSVLSYAVGQPPRPRCTQLLRRTPPHSTPNRMPRIRLRHTPRWPGTHFA